MRRLSTFFWTVKQLLTIFMVVLAFPAMAQMEGLKKQNLNQGWFFTKSPVVPGKQRVGAVDWQPVTLPHTWNAEDVMDDTPGYYRGACWYRKDLVLDSRYKDKEISLMFEGANQQTEVFVNGKKAGEHTGGYTAFTVPISWFLTPFLTSSRNEILVKVDNRFNEAVPPLSADFTFYGGLYRDVWLLTTEAVHFERRKTGNSGVRIATPDVKADKASVQISSTLTNDSRQVKQVIVTSIIKNREGQVVVQRRTTAVLPASEVKTVLQAIDAIEHPHLWSPDDPYLYTVVTTISDRGTGQVFDQSKNPLGFRWFQFDAENGFFLNGKSYKLIGTSRHQDYEGLGNAVPDSLARRDLVMLKNIGANFLRVAHYPQDPSVLQLCDSLGLLASVEIPVVNEVTESEAFYRNCEVMQQEMIRQNYNHPSVVLWCYMNEVLLKPHFAANSDRQKTYIANITKLAKRLDSLTRKEDPYRPTMIAHHGDLNKYADAGLVDIPAVVGWNLYSGWYGGDTTGFPRFLDAFHKRYPHKPMLVTEYGADADPRIHSHAPVRFDKSVEYTTLFHQYYLSQIRSRPFVAGGVVWNLADFNSESRTESMPHINNKGLLQWNRTPKDPWYFYEAALQRNPVTRILASENKRTGFPDRNNVCLQPLMVASNSDTVEVFLNGASLGKKVVQNYLCQWMIPFTGGSNELKAIGWHKTAVSEDAASINFRMQPEVLQTASFTFQPLNILMCSSRYYTDEEHTLWQPTREYQNGRWGSVGGRAFRIDSNSRLPFGTDRNILQTADDPLYQTQWVGIQQYRLDVPPGTYQLTLYFAELQGGSVPPLPYNLVAAGRTEPGAARVFDVLVNDQPFLKNFNLAADYGIAVPVRKTVSVAVSRGEGIVVSFHPITGEPVLNALEVKKEN